MGYQHKFILNYEIAANNKQSSDKVAGKQNLSFQPITKWYNFSRYPSSTKLYHFTLPYHITFMLPNLLI